MLTNIKDLAEMLGNTEAIKAELKRVQSVKCRLKKQKARADYEEEMAKVVGYEQALKEAREYFEPKNKPTTQLTQEDIALLNYEETMKAIKSIQSKKCNSQYLTADININVEYQKACEIEAWLLEHKKTVKPVDDYCVKKSSINDIIEHLEGLDQNLDKTYVVDMLKKLIEEEA